MDEADSAGVATPRRRVGNAPDRRIFLWLEVSAFSATHLDAILTPLAFGMALRAGLLSLGGNIEAIVTDVTRGGLYLFVIFGSGDRMIRFGLRPIRLDKDLTPFLAAFVAGGAILWIESWWRLQGRISETSKLWFAHNHAPLALAAVTCLAIGSFEELAFRGYLLTRLEELFRSTQNAVLAQAIFFGLVHSYQGFAGVAQATCFGLVMGVVFVKRRSLWPIALAHALCDLFWILGWSHVMAS